MQFPTPLHRGTLIKRYKRFLADVTLDTGEDITAHCPNSGAMLGVKDSGSTVYLSKSDNPKRKHAYTLEMVEADETGDGATLVGVNTSNPNRIVKEALLAKQIPELAAYDEVKAEVKHGNSRLDFCLTCEGQPPCWVEVKNCHLKRQSGLLEFPDSVTSRGAKHLQELIGLKEQGHRAVMLYLCQRGDGERFGICADIDPAYGEAFQQAKAAGVEMLAYGCEMTASGITLSHQLSVF